MAITRSASLPAAARQTSGKRIRRAFFPVFHHRCDALPRLDGRDFFGLPGVARGRPVADLGSIQNPISLSLRRRRRPVDLGAWPCSRRESGREHLTLQVFQRSGRHGSGLGEREGGLQIEALTAAFLVVGRDTLGLARPDVLDPVQLADDVRGRERVAADVTFLGRLTFVPGTAHRAGGAEGGQLAVGTATRLLQERPIDAISPSLVIYEAVQADSEMARKRALDITLALAGPGTNAMSGRRGKLYPGRKPSVAR